MRHLNKGRQLSRSSEHKKALLGNLTQELFEHKRIKTTLGKARELRPFAEKLITKAKSGTLAARRDVARFCSRNSAVQELFNEIAPKMAERPGGYTRIIKLGPRVGDAAPLAIIELVGYEGAVTTPAPAAEEKKPAKKKKKADA
ncbi:MAG: 50S ribosomal protein L17 [Calditrichaeota bacterium]|nr:50S ribosomal protein L17 [Calditrichota bacterium]MCB9366241.1 50S ribosomal protein L17 [Calditrichota bacterium]MCB9391690.1 50S ribosomal protein L17 [Calditrichota bacterium]